MIKFTEKCLNFNYKELGKTRTEEKVICKINTPQHRKGELVDRFDLEIDRLDYPDVYIPSNPLVMAFRGNRSRMILDKLMWELNNKEKGKFIILPYERKICKNDVGT